MTSGSTMQQMPVAMQSANSPDAAWASVAPTACETGDDQGEGTRESCDRGDDAGDDGVEERSGAVLLASTGSAHADFSSRRGLVRHDRRRGVFEHGRPGHDDAGDVVARRHLEHDRPEHVLDDRAEAAGAGLAQHGEVGDRLERALRRTRARRRRARTCAGTACTSAFFGSVRISISATWSSGVTVRRRGGGR